MPCWALLAGWWSSPLGLAEEEALSECTLHYQHSYRFSSHFRAECWQVWTGRGKECVSLPQVREPSLVTHLCFTVSVSLAVFVLVSLACKCYCCSWECFKWNERVNSLSCLSGFLFVCCLIFCSCKKCLWEQAKESCVCDCAGLSERSFVFSAGLRDFFWVLFVRHNLNCMPILICPWKKIILYGLSAGLLLIQIAGLLF